jgi:hypothetical protein
VDFCFAEENIAEVCIVFGINARQHIAITIAIFEKSEFLKVVDKRQGVTPLGRPFTFRR